VKGKINEVEGTFNASVGQFDRLKSRVELRNVKITGEAASANEVAAYKYPYALNK
jgi:hypothetical protein